MRKVILQNGVLQSVSLGEGNAYSINRGNWYKINNDFATEINDAYNNIRLSGIEFIDCPQNHNVDLIHLAIILS